MELRFSEDTILNKKKKSNKSGYPDEAIKILARCFYPSMVEFFNSEEGAAVALDGQSISLPQNKH